METKKRMLEIELNESLKRREEELQSKIESIVTAGSDSSVNLDDLDARVRELNQLENSIADLRKKMNG